VVKTNKNGTWEGKDTGHHNKNGQGGHGRGYSSGRRYNQLWPTRKATTAPWPRPQLSVRRLLAFFLFTWDPAVMNTGVAMNTAPSGAPLQLISSTLVTSLLFVCQTSFEASSAHCLISKRGALHQISIILSQI